jgi:hypothetical protein
LSPAPIVEEAQDEEEASEEEAEEADVEEAGEEQEGQGELQWVYEDGTAAQSFDESDSSLDSLDADQSLDIVSSPRLCKDLADQYSLAKASSRLTRPTVLPKM